MINRVVRVGVPAVIGGLLLSGCSGGATPGTAVVVGAEHLTVSEVQDRTASYVKTYPEAQSGVTAAEVSTLGVQTFIENVVTDALAAERGIAVTETQVDDFIEQLGGMAATTQAAAGPGLLVPPNPALVRQAVKHTLLLQALGTDLAPAGATSDEISQAVFGAIEDKAKSMNVEVNPRFGEWDGSIVTASNGSLSTPLSDLGADPSSTLDPAAPTQG